MGKFVKVGCVLLCSIEFMELSDYSVRFQGKGEVAGGFVVPAFEQFLAGVTVEGIVNF